MYTFRKTKCLYKNTEKKIASDFAHIFNQRFVKDLAKDLPRDFTKDLTIGLGNKLPYMSK